MCHLIKKNYYANYNIALIDIRFHKKLVHLTELEHSVLTMVESNESSKIINQ